MTKLYDTLGADFKDRLRDRRWDLLARIEADWYRGFVEVDRLRRRQ